MNENRESARRSEKYAEYLSDHPALTDIPADAGIELITDPVEMSQVEGIASERLNRKGYPDNWAHVGVAYTDEYLNILRDAVRFPNGQVGTYIRVLQRQENFPGVAVLPICKSRIVLVEHYRHATRDWHWEIPRGFGETASPETNARLELREELGAECSRLELLGKIHTNSGLLSEQVHLFYAEIGEYTVAENKEPIRAVDSFDWASVKTLLCDGTITDSFTIAALGFAEWKGVICESSQKETLANKRVNRSGDSGGN